MRKSSVIPLMMAVNVLLCVFAQHGFGQSISVDDAKIGFHLFPNTGFDVPVSNSANRVIRGTLYVEMLSEDEKDIVARHQIDFQAPRGVKVVTLPWGDVPAESPPYLAPYRLRYTIKPVRSSDFRSVHGVIQIGPHLVDGFTIQGYPGGQFSCSLDCQFLVRVAEPHTGRGLPGYDTNIRFGGDNGTVIHTITDKDGYAAVRYTLPGDPAYPNTFLDVKASHGAFRTGWGTIICRKRPPPHLTVATDKPVYRPGETIHAHLILIGIDGKPWVDGNLSLAITDINKDRELFRKKLRTSQSGESSTDWTLPSDMKEAQLSVFATSEDQPENNLAAKSKVKIRIEPEEKPDFTIQALPDQSYYLPGQNAKLAVSASDLSGHPIRNAKVHVKTVYAAESEGNLDGSGKFVASIDLKNMWDSPLARWPGPITQNFPIEVSLTDNATGHTQLRWLDLPLANQAVGLYIRDQGVASGSERTLDIVTTYVDRSPASVNGTAQISAPDPNGQCSQVQIPAPAQLMTLGTFYSNQYGVARLVLPLTWINYPYPKRIDGPYSQYAREPRPTISKERATKKVCILLHATDVNGKTGTLFQELIVDPERRFATRFSTDHALYHPGQPIQVGIESDAGLTEAVVEVRTPSEELVGVQHVQLANGRVDLTFPYTPQFRGLLTVQVYAVTSAKGTIPGDLWTRQVVYPTGERLKFGERWPGDAWEPDSVEPDHPRADPSYLDRGKIPGIEKADLLSLDPSKPFPQGLDLTVSALLGPTQSWSDGTQEYMTSNPFQHGR